MLTLVKYIMKMKDNERVRGDPLIHVETMIINLTN